MACRMTSNNVPRSPDLSHTEIKKKVLITSNGTISFLLLEMTSTLEHFSHSKHLLRLKEDDVIRVDAKCCLCNKPVIGSLTYTCTSDDSDCQSFYLHKSCAELPIQINHPKHNKHHLALLPRPKNYLCNVCGHHVQSFSYTCDCDFDVCVSCAFEQKVLRHEGHEDHILTLMQREALFKCDACREEAKDTSYVCTTCQFWIHKRCALSPFFIPDPTFHHHPLHLVYSIPEMHRYFKRFCAICNKRVHTVYWLYYCHKCTYFVHMKCATSLDSSIINKIEADGIDNEPDLVQFPLLDEESLFDLIITQCGKFEFYFQGESENSITMSTTSNCPHIIEEHWSHKNHPLEQLHFTLSETDSDNNGDDRKVLICDGCIQPITASRPSYYACIQCGFFLHSFCASKLPQKLPAGASLFHPQHSLLLQKTNIFYKFVLCEVCGYFTNGFYYHCDTCDINIDIRCIFLPTRIKHKSHKNHTLVQRPFSNSVCRVGKIRITFGVEYACETCSDFQINILSAFYPSRMKHKYDLHPSSLRHPPFFYEGVFYCEICEEQVNNQLWLYHCGECDHSFHCDCLRWYESIKLGGTIELTFSNQPHTLALVLKRSTRKNSPLYTCGNCGDSYKLKILFECDGCSLLICRNCAIEILGE